MMLYTDVVFATTNLKDDQKDRVQQLCEDVTCIRSDAFKLGLGVKS